jgi:hypothetical protein
MGDVHFAPLYPFTTGRCLVNCSMPSGVDWVPGQLQYAPPLQHLLQGAPQVGLPHCVTGATGFTGHDSSIPVFEAAAALGSGWLGCKLLKWCTPRLLSRELFDLATAWGRRIEKFIQWCPLGMLLVEASPTSWSNLRFQLIMCIMYQ